MTRHKHPLPCAIELSSLHLWFRVLTKEQVEHQRELKDLPGNLDYRRESPTIQSHIDGSRQKEWKKYEDFQAAIPLEGKGLSDLLEAGHVPIPSKWVDTINYAYPRKA